MTTNTSRELRALLDAAVEESHQLQDRLTHVSRLATVGEMAAGIAHELNQPLAAMATYAHACDRLLALPDPDIEEVRSALKLLAAQAVRAGDIIRRMRTLARGEESARAPVNVNTLIAELASLINSDAKAHGVSCRQELAPDLPLVSANSAQIQQVVVNLVRNALEALAPQRAAAARAEVVVATRGLADGRVEISISDNGPGVSEALKDRIFDPFCTTKATGTGLGLAISRTIVAAHAGTLDYEPNQPNGARFNVRLAPESMDPALKDRPVLVFIVDDDDAVRNSIRLLMKSLGLATRTLCTAQEFIAAYDPQQPGCLILDVRMPGMSGLELQQQLNLRGAIIPVIFITGHGDVPMAVEAMQQGAFDFLQKPFRDQDLIERVQRALAKDQSNRTELSERAKVRERFDSLTPREREVLALVTSGKANKVMAADLNLSQRTVEIHRARVMEKMRANSLAQLVRMMLDVEELPRS